jgi:3-phosphoshikimate 1-carboxyvinyltransferase
VTDAVLLRRPARIRGTIRVPGDKSISHRALLLAALADGVSLIRGRAPGADQQSMANCLRELGVTISDDGAVTRVEGNGLRGLRPPAAELDCGNSGATMRFLTGAIAGTDGVRAGLTGDASLSRRPMERVAAPLRAMGAGVTTAPGGVPPVTVEGRRLHGTAHALPVASAQVKTAILLAALNAEGPTVITEPQRSRDHTERMLLRLGVDLTVADAMQSGFTVPGAITLLPPDRIQSFDIEIPGDPSAAAFWIVLATAHPNAEIDLPGVCINPTRTAFLTVLERMGATIDRRNSRDVSGEPLADLHVTTSRLHAIEVNTIEVPALIDEIPVLAVAAACAEGESVFRGLAELRVKEIDRLEAIAEQLGKLGAWVRVDGDDLHVTGGRGLEGSAVASGGDHRMAMALAVAASLADGETSLSGTRAAGISYPAFFADLAAVSV